MLQVKIFDEENEQDLMQEVNRFLKTIEENDVIEIKYSIACFGTIKNEQVYCYSAFIMYRVMLQ